MEYALTRTVEPAEEPISHDEARAHMRAADDEPPTVIESFIKACRVHTEDISSCMLCTQTWKMTIDYCFPQEIRIPLRPVQSITSIKYIDEAGVQQTLAAGKYKLAKGFIARINPAYNESWPGTRAEREAVEIIFIGGFGAAKDVPETLKLAIKLLLAHYSENREATIPGVSLQSIPMGYDRLVGPERVWRV